MSWWRALPDVLTHEDAVLVTVARTQGSVPREAGTSMLVTLTDTVDTIGGGHLEWEAMAQARAMLLQASAVPAMHRLSLGASLGQCCGGVVWLVFERVGQAALPAWQERMVQLGRGEGIVRVLSSVDAQSTWSSVDKRSTSTRNGPADGGCAIAYPPYETRLDTNHFPSPAPDGAPSPEGEGTATRDGQQSPPPGGRVVRSTGRGEMPQSWHFTHFITPTTFPITIFGAGHVGAAIVRVLAPLGAQIRWVDPRDDQFGVPPANVECITSDAPEEAVASAPAHRFFLVLTHSHALDLTLSELILRRNDFAWFGLIGSKTKRARFEHRLHALGLDTTRMQCPIGIAGISDKSPEAIAIAVVAQVLQVKEQLKQGAALAC